MMSLADHKNLLKGYSRPVELPRIASLCQYVLKDHLITLQQSAVPVSLHPRWAT